jgi:hypothetical protein
MKDIGKLAAKKGLKPFTWKAYTLIGWVTSEFFGIIVGLQFFGKNNLISVVLVGITFAITSYYFIKAQLNKLPDKGIDDDIDHFGQPLS